MLASGKSAPHHDGIGLELWPQAGTGVLPLPVPKAGAAIVNNPATKRTSRSAPVTNSGDDLFARAAQEPSAYTAKDIEVLEGLEPVRRRPAMYIGGTDERALHHLVAELLDNAVDEAVAGHASRIELRLTEDGRVNVRDNGRGIPVDPHPKFPDRSALEVILTTLHSGGKFGGSAYATSGGLHGVGLSVVNALAESLTIEVARDRMLWTQSYARGVPTSPLNNAGTVQNRRGTSITFRADPLIFGSAARFEPAVLYRMARSKAYLFRGMEIRWSCAASQLSAGEDVPDEAVLHFPDGIADYLRSALGDRETVTPEAFTGEATLAGDRGRIEWAVTWPTDEDGFFTSYCNTVPTPQGGTHEAGFRSALTKAIRAYGERVKNRDVEKLIADDVIAGACVMLSLFLREPQFQGQTKEKLVNADATRLIEVPVRDHVDHWLSATPAVSDTLLAHVLDRAQQRLQRRQDKSVKRQSATRRLRLPGKLTDCARESAQGTELFLVEGDSAGGSAKQARERETQAVLPLRGKILNVASASAEKLRANQELRDLIEALGCGSGTAYAEAALRYEKIVIMTDADVDGAHIASLLITFFFREMPKLIEHGHLFLAAPPLYRLSRGAKTLYARDDAHKAQLLASEFVGRGDVDISRFKGLGEMPAAQLKTTTMAPASRTLLRIVLPSAEASAERSVVAERIETLMGRRPELRFALISEHARFVADTLDV
ncbi:MAG: type IIA DNA topoisomerase subunit B [Rhodospirillales bacterium]|nr:type IIA DNA topoisomerase subunit B [Rhodospirillales bacterium]